MDGDKKKQIQFSPKQLRAKADAIKDYVRKIRQMSVAEITDEFERKTGLRLAPDTPREALIARLLFMKIDEIL